MKEIQVTYMLDENDDQYKKILNLLEIVRKTESPTEKGKFPFENFTLEKVFEMCMRYGSKHKIDKAINEYEYLFHLIG